VPPGHVMHQAVFGGADLGDGAAKTRPVDHALGMLDAKPQGKRLGIDGDAAVMQHLECVAGAVPRRQHHMIGFDLLARFQRHTAQLPVFDFQAGELAAKTILPAQLLDGLAQTFHHGDQAEGADMGMGLGENFLGRAGLDEFVQHLAAQVAWILDLAVELAVAEGARAALAELDIGFGIEHRTAPQAPGVFGAFAHRLAALQDDGAEAGLGQDQGGEQAARPRAHHQRAGKGPGRRMGREAILHVGAGAYRRLTREPPQQRGLVGDLGIDRINISDGRAVARVVTALEDMKALQRRGIDLQPPDDGGPQRLGRVVERKFDIGQAQHGAHI